jgi:hypothetical protein
MSAVQSNKENSTIDEGFFIGWMPKAPVAYAKHIRKVILTLGVLVIITGVVLALSQKKFGRGNFEFGILTEVKGIYYASPVPCIKLLNGKDIWGNPSYITAPLLGFGKHGADGVMGDIEKEKGYSLNGKEISLKGTLLYNDGKLLVQVDANDHPLTKIGNMVAESLQPIVKELGQMEIKGEIVDPKCFFGVMKPGQGKPHKDCAIRCILGGIPPVLRVINDKGDANYYLMVGAHGEKMNKAVKDFVAEPVTVHARVVNYDDWVLLYVNDNNGIAPYSYIREVFGKNIQYCATGCPR